MLSIVQLISRERKSFFKKKKPKRVRVKLVFGEPESSTERKEIAVRRSENGEFSVGRVFGDGTDCDIGRMKGRPSTDGVAGKRRIACDWNLISAVFDYIVRLSSLTIECQRRTVDQQTQTQHQQHLQEDEFP